jgi:citrate lyase beta subunit
MKHFKLGASIYVPAIRDDINAIANEKKISARSFIFCTEDSINESDVSFALTNLDKMLNSTVRSENTLKFIRVRNEQVLKTVLEMNKIKNIDGFVFPKITAYNFENYMKVFKETGHENHDFSIMPTIETKEVFQVQEMENLRNIFLNEEYKDHILSLRIGGNDLLNILGVRRSRYRTIYESPLNVTITNLITTFKPYGFNLTSPVCEFLHDTELLKREVPLDLEFGLFGKTAIHPDQISIIENAYMATETDVAMANAILADDAPGVFGMHGAMCEKATHSNWAREILERAKIYGIFGANRSIKIRAVG